jgi:hypothetical protein
MHFRQIYLFIIITGLFISGCQKLITDPGNDTIGEVKSDEGLNYWGGAYNDEGHAVVQTYDGGFAVAGTQYSSGTQYDLSLVTFNSTLVEQSSKIMDFAIAANDSFPNYASDIQQTPDGGYVSVGSTYNGTDYDALVIKFNTSLDTVWTISIGTAGSDDFGNSIGIMSSGKYLVCGTSYDATNHDHDITVWGLTSAGISTPLYVETNNGLHDYGNYAEQTSDGGIIIIGTQGDDISLIKLISDGDGSFSPDADSCSVGDGLLLTENACTGATPAGMWYTGFSSDGSLTTGTANLDEGVYVQQLYDGSYIIVGNTQAGTGQQSNVYINTITKTGETGTAVTMGGAYNDKVTCVRQTDDGGFIFTGSKYGQSTMKDVWVAKLTRALTVHWDYTYGGNLNDHGQSIAQTYDGGYVVTGSTMSYGNQSDIILLKLDSYGIVDDIIGDLSSSSGN